MSVIQRPRPLDDGQKLSCVQSLPPKCKDFPMFCFVSCPSSLLTYIGLSDLINDKPGISRTTKTPPTNPKDNIRRKPKWEPMQIDGIHT